MPISTSPTGKPDWGTVYLELECEIRLRESARGERTENLLAIKTKACTGVGRGEEEPAASDPGSK